MLATVLAGRDVEADGVLVVDHHAIAAEVHPPVVGILGDIERAGADVAAAVELVPLRGGELEYVDLGTAHDILKDGTVLHDLRHDVRNALARPLLPRLHELVGSAVDGQAERHGDSPERPEPIRQDAKTLFVTDDLVEDRGLRGSCAAEDLGRHPDVLFGVRAGDGLKLANLVDLLEPFADIGRRLHIGANRRGHVLDLRLALFGFESTRKGARPPAIIGDGHAVLDGELHPHGLIAPHAR